MHEKLYTSTSAFVFCINKIFTGVPAEVQDKSPIGLHYKEHQQSSDDGFMKSEAQGNIL